MLPAVTDFPNKRNISYRQRQKQKNKQTGREPDKQTEKHRQCKYGQKKRQTNKQTSRQANIKRKRQTDRTEHQADK